MDLSSSHRTPIRVGFIALIAALNLSGEETTQPHNFSPEIPQNPISKLARLVNPKLAKVEDRVNWLTREAYTLARYHQFPQRFNLGYRGHRITLDAPDPTIVLDFGEVKPIDSIYLIPTRREYLNDTGIFPQRFTIEISEDSEFTDPHLVYTTGKELFRNNEGLPASFEARHKGRYLRISVQRGHSKGSLDVFGLSEIFVFSNGTPISFGAEVSTTGELEISPLWHPHALTDGRSPLGIWHHGKAIHGERGDVVEITQRGTTTSWQVDLGKEQPINEIILFPYQVGGSHYTSIYPDSLRIELNTPGKPNSMMITDWNMPLPGANQHAPMAFSFDGMTARTVTITATSYWIISQRTLHALSEIEVWSEGRNLIAGKPVVRSHDNEKTEVMSLTDGNSSERKIIPIQSWLEQLIKRGQIKEELAGLSSIHSQLSTRSELNVSWGSAVILGLIFMIPVFIFESKRNKSKAHLDIMRKRIAADLHDDIGSNLGSISMIARCARKELARLNGPEEVDKDLDEVETIARESSLAMRDIVWLLERKQDSIGDLIHRMRETANRLLRNATFTFDCNSNNTAAKLTLDAKRHLFLFYKEAIHNIVKHSQADKVSIRLWDETGDRLGMEIIDNGVGLPVNGDNAPVILKKLQERADVMGGDIELNSSAEKGTTIRLLVKRSKLTNPSKSS